MSNGAEDHPGNEIAPGVFMSLTPPVAAEANSDLLGASHLSRSSTAKRMGTLLFDPSPAHQVLGYLRNPALRPEGEKERPPEFDAGTSLDVLGRDCLGLDVDEQAHAIHHQVWISAQLGFVAAAEGVQSVQHGGAVTKH